tara:strand:+ start:89 stop:844 length:756 start_codon:yes stop_codon:yes gene_type:complete
MRLEDKVVFISGGARSIGAAIAELFAREGAKVVIGDVLEEEGRQTETQINETGGACLFVRLDVTSETEWQQALASTVAHFGKLDVLVNNAGTYRTGLVEEITSEQWDQDVAINAKGAFLGTKLAIHEMRKAGGGSIINISSIAGLEGSMEASCTYTMSKAAMRLLTKSTAVQYGREGIRVNAIVPASIKTTMNAHLMAERDQEEMLNSIPMGRTGRPEDVAYGALYLASDDSSFVTGSDLVIDGGIAAGRG